MNKTILNKDLNTDVTKMIVLNDLRDEDFREIKTLNEVGFSNANDASLNKRRFMDERVHWMVNNAISLMDESLDLNNDLSSSEELKNRILNTIYHHFTYSKYDRYDKINAIFGKGIQEQIKKTYDRNDVFLERNDSTISIDIYYDKTKNMSNVAVRDYMNRYDDNAGIIYFQLDEENSVKFIENIMISKLDDKVSNNKVSQSLRELWYHQSKEFVKFEKTTEDMENNHLRHIFDNVKNAMTSEINGTGKVDFTYAELFAFMEEVRNQEITEKTSNVQNWFTFKNSDDVIYSIMNHENYKNLNNIALADDDNEAIKIKKEMLSQKHFKNNVYISKIYKLNDEKPLRKGYERIKGSHGTSNRSLMSIMLNGLKSASELIENENTDYQFTGNGLGSGVYFARLNQSSKSSNYIKGSHDKAYMVVADIDYDPKNVKVLRSYDSSLETKPYSLVIGEKVGSYDIDELLAPHSENINIRYVLEISKKR